MQQKLNIARLVQDCGGARRVAEITGTNRTAPYRWMTAAYISSKALEKLKSARPDLVLDDYFERVH